MFVPSLVSSHKHPAARHSPACNILYTFPLRIRFSFFLSHPPSLSPPLSPSPSLSRPPSYSPDAHQDPWYNGPQRGYGRDEANSPGIALDAKAVQVFFLFL